MTAFGNLVIKNPYRNGTYHFRTMSLEAQVHAVVLRFLSWLRRIRQFDR